MKSYVYVDYENMNNLKSYPEIEGKYFFFIGSTQLTMPTFMHFYEKEGLAETIQIEGTGKNALDFHIAYYLAKNDSEKEVFHYVLSKDSGYDPLIAHINKRHNSEIAKRIISLEEIQNEENQSQNVNSSQVELSSDWQSKYDKIIKNLKSIGKSARPKSEKTLKAHIKTLVGSENNIEQFVAELYKNKIISKGSGNKLSYSI